jgi:UDP-glucose 4-epimerase
MGPKRALVTGGAGFIGSHVADQLLAADYEVTILDNLSSGRRENVPAAASFVHDEITSTATAELVRSGGFSVLFHLAAQIDVRRSVADPVFDAGVNVLGSLNLLEAARTASVRPRVVFSSTGGALYGGFATPPTDEETPTDPEAPYGIAKLSVEYYLAYYARVHGLDTVALRYGNVYGPRQDPHGEAGVIAIFCHRILDGRRLTVFGDGAQTRDYVFVGDVARANVLAATAPLPDAGRVSARAFNIGTGVETSVNTVAASLQRAAGTEQPIDYAPARAGEIQRSALAAQKACDVLGWSPGVSVDAGLDETYRWFVAHRAGATA